MARVFDAVLEGFASNLIDTDVHAAATSHVRAVRTTLFNILCDCIRHPTPAVGDCVLNALYVLQDIVLKTNGPAQIKFKEDNANEIRQIMGALVVASRLQSGFERASREVMEEVHRHRGLIADAFGDLCMMIGIGSYLEILVPEFTTAASRIGHDFDPILCEALLFGVTSIRKFIPGGDSKVCDGTVVMVMRSPWMILLLHYLLFLLIYILYRSLYR